MYNTSPFSQLQQSSFCIKSVAVAQKMISLLVSEQCPLQALFGWHIGYKEPRGTWTEHQFEGRHWSISKEDQTLEETPFAGSLRSFMFSLKHFVLLLMTATVPGCGCPVDQWPQFSLRWIRIEPLNPLKLGTYREKWRNLKDGPVVPLAAWVTEKGNSSPGS